MPRAKKKATVASAPPSEPPAAKRRKMDSSTVNGNVNVATPNRGSGNIQTKTKVVTRSDTAYVSFSVYTDD